MTMRSPIEGIEAAAHLAAIIESSDDAILSKKLDGTITSWNAGASRIFGYGVEEILGKSIMILIPEDRQAEEPLILEKISRGERVDHYETMRRRKDGSLLPISLTVSPIKDATGRVIGASKIARDISDRNLLVNEIEHRVKNTLAVVQALAALTLKSTASAELEVFNARLGALANAHDLLRKGNWNFAALRAVVARALQPFPADRLQVTGPDVALDGAKSQAITLALHELGTNAAKYGALSNERGRVRINWIVFDPSLSRLVRDRRSPRHLARAQRIWLGSDGAVLCWCRWQSRDPIRLGGHYLDAGDGGLGCLPAWRTASAHGQWKAKPQAGEDSEHDDGHRRCAPVAKPNDAAHEVDLQSDRDHQRQHGHCDEPGGHPDEEL
jgi:PAS domain S-box-containing protein